MTSNLVDLAAPTVDRPAVGGKAAVLAELSEAGLPVPPGVVVTAAGMDDQRLDAQLQAAASRLDGDRFLVSGETIGEEWATPPNAYAPGRS